MSRLFADNIAMIVFMAGIVIGSCTAGAAAVQDDDPKNKEEKKDKKPATVTVEEEELRIFEKLDGVFQCSNSAEIKTDVKAWTDLAIENVVKQGTKVKSGEVVLAFDTEKLDDAVTEAEFALKSAALSLEDAKLAAEQAQVEFDLNNEMNEREMKHAENDYEYYRDTERKERQKNLDWSLKSADYSLEYAEEELNQLLKMYTEDELTEESEKIVLKRAQRGVESSQRWRDRQQLTAKRQMEANFPREDVRREESLKRKELEYKKTKTTLPFTRDRAAIALRKAEFAFEKAKRKLGKLEEDRKHMELKSPMSGVLFHGRYANGKWTGATGSTTRELEVHKKLPAKKVALTVVNPEKLTIRVEIPEDKLKFFDSQTTGTAILKADDSTRWKVKVNEINPVPLASGARECVFEIEDLDNKDAKVLPSMNCKISVGVYENKEALVVAKASVFSDDGFTHYVYMEDKQRKEVEVGHTSGDKIEITKGLKAGDKILKAKP